MHGKIQQQLTLYFTYASVRRICGQGGSEQKSKRLDTMSSQLKDTGSNHKPGQGGETKAPRALQGLQARASIPQHTPLQTVKTKSSGATLSTDIFYQHFGAI